MIDGVLTVCPNCGREIDAIRDVKGMLPTEALIYIAFKCQECGFMGRMTFGRQFFQERLVPWLKWFGGGQTGTRPRTPNELLLKEFEIDMEAVEHVGDLELYWAATPGRQEKGRG